MNFDISHGCTSKQITNLHEKNWKTNFVLDQHSTFGPLGVEDEHWFLRIHNDLL